MSRREWGCLGLLGLCALLGASLVPVNHDEGWILLAGQAWQEGRLPGRDFAFPQGPLLAAIYSLGQGIPGEALIQGRRVSVVLALGTALFGVLTARRLRQPGVWVALLLLVNPWVLGHLVQVKGFGPGAFLLSFSLWCLAGQGRGAQLFGAAALALGTTGVRMSLGGPLLALLLWRRRSGWIWAGAAAGACTGALPWWGLETGAVWDQVWGVHMGPYGDRGLAPTVAGKLVLLGRMAVLVAPVGVLALVGRLREEELRAEAQLPLWPMLIAGVLAHLLPGTEHGEYVVLLWPLVVLVGVGGYGSLQGGWRRAWWGAVGAHFLWGINALEFEVAGPPPGEGCRVLGGEVARSLGAGQFLVGFEPLVAAEAGRRVLPGLEMGLFSLARGKDPLRLTGGEVVNRVVAPGVGAALLGERMFLHDGWNQGYSQEETEGWRAGLSSRVKEQFCPQLQLVGVGQFKEEMSLFVRGPCP